MTKRIEILLNDLAGAAQETPPAALAEKIKNAIPLYRQHHSAALDKVNIIIDLRINRLAAAAVIVATLLVSMSFFAARGRTGSDIYQDGKLLVRYCFGGSRSEEFIGGTAKLYQDLARQGKQVVFFEDFADQTPDANTILLYWKQADGSYRVVFTDHSIHTVNSEQIISLQAVMLQKRQ